MTDSTRAALEALALSGAADVMQIDDLRARLTLLAVRAEGASAALDGSARRVAIVLRREAEALETFLQEIKMGEGFADVRAALQRDTGVEG